MFWDKRSKTQKAVDKASKLIQKGQYDKAIRILRPFAKKDKSAKRLLDSAIGLKKSVKALRSDPLHKNIKGNIRVRSNKPHRWWWPF